jgi:hypothetical protein
MGNLQGKFSSPSDKGEELGSGRSDNLGKWRAIAGKMLGGFNISSAKVHLSKT